MILLAVGWRVGILRISIFCSVDGRRLTVTCPDWQSVIQNQRFMKNLPILLILLLVSCQQSSTIVQDTTSKVVADASPIEEVQKTNSYKKAKPLEYYPTQWTELITLDSTIILDLRYATENNFVKEQMYDCGRCFLRPRVARRVYRAHQILKKRGLGLKMFDCYRPRPIQQKLWDKVPNANYVTPPAKDSMHNKGSAVDLTIVNEDGDELYMGTEFDYFGKEGHHTYQDLPKEVLANRRLLKSTMEEVGLAAIRTEWWHYSFKGQAYDISDWVWKCK